jgi:hypothetical protein
MAGLHSGEAFSVLDTLRLVMSKSIERFLMLTILVLAILVSCKARSPATPAPALAMDQAARAVAIATTCGSTGSGVVIGERSVLTAAHVVATCPPPYLIRDGAGALRVATLEAVLDTDLARLRLLPGSIPLASPTPVAVAAAKVGDRVCLQSGGHGERRCGKVRSVSNGRAGLRHTAITIPGDSGSGLYRSDGVLLGVVVVCDVDGGACTRTGGGASPLASVAWVTR